MTDRGLAEKFRDLVPLLREARAPSRELDRAVAEAVEAPRAYFDKIASESGSALLGPDYSFDDVVDGPECFAGQPVWAALGVSWNAPPYTQSVDSVMVEIARVLPDTVRVGLVQQPNKSWRASITRVGPDSVPSFTVAGQLPGSTLAAALIYGFWLELGHRGHTALPEYWSVV